MKTEKEKKFESIKIALEVRKPEENVETLIENAKKIKKYFGGPDEGVVKFIESFKFALEIRKPEETIEDLIENAKKIFDYYIEKQQTK